MGGGDTREIHDQALPLPHFLLLYQAVHLGISLLQGHESLGEDPGHILMPLRHDKRMAVTVLLGMAVLVSMAVSVLHDDTTTDIVTWVVGTRMQLENASLSECTCNLSVSNL
jgi:hypothetical protein